MDVFSLGQGVADKQIVSGDGFLDHGAILANSDCGKTDIVGADGNLDVFLEALGTILS